MTQLEQRALSLIIAACRQYLDDHDAEPDWEQRRYEIASRLYASDRSVSAENAVAWADKLIEELKKKKED